MLRFVAAPPPHPPSPSDPLEVSASAQPPPAAQNVIATNTPSAQAAAVMTTGERPRFEIPPNPSESVVLAPELTSSQGAPPVPPQAGGLPRASAAPPLYTGPSIVPTFTPPPPSRAGLFFVLGGASLLAVALGTVLFGLRPRMNIDPSADATAAPSPPPAASTAPAPSRTAAPSSTPAVPVKNTAPANTTAAPAPSGAPPGSREADARAALAKLRDGVGVCVRDVIGVLPGTSPAVPGNFAKVGRGAYKSTVHDFRSPVFACVNYKQPGTQRFQIQWQMVSHPGEGRGVAWIDENGDGKADRAFAFRAALTGKNQVDLGEIGPLDPLPPVMKPQ
jgi:hypothetical protein